MKLTIEKHKLPFLLIFCISFLAFLFLMGYWLGYMDGIDKAISFKNCSPNIIPFDFN